MKNYFLIAGFGAILLLVGCGGGGGGGVSVTPPTCTDTQILDNGTCRAIMESDCTGTTPIFDSENGVCVARPVENLFQPACANGETTGFCINARREYDDNDGLANINAQSAYSAGYFGQGVTVAVVDSGMLVTHEDLRDNVVEWRDFVYPTRTTIDDPSNHGTLVGGIIAATRGNSGAHGVAPAAKLIALKIGDDDGALGSGTDALRYAVSANVNIVNHSYTAGTLTAYMDGGDTDYLVLPGGFVPFISDSNERSASFTARALFNDISNEDIVNVWAAGNEGWNSETGRVITCEELMDGACRDMNPSREDFNDLINSFTGAPYYFGGNYRVGMPSYQSVYPLYVAADTVRDSFLGENGSFINAAEPLDEIYSGLMADDDFAAMASRWLVVTALDRDDRIATYSNGCGVAAYWCISAPGSEISGPLSTGDSNYRTQADGTLGFGTSFAAPHASGALAVIQSAMPEMPISVAVAVLLESADDLGEQGVDVIYGWGGINLSAALMTVAGLNMANAGAGLSAVSYAELRQELPARFDYLPSRLQEVSVAIQITDNAYYNIGLADMLSTSGKAESSIGDGAAALLRPAATDSAPGFFAYGAHHSEIGLRYYGKLSGFSLMADMAHLAAETDFVGGDLGALGAIDSKSNTGKLQFLRTIGDNWQLFGGYEYAALRANAGGDGLISDIGNVHADGYNIGLALGDIWRFGDQFSLSAKRETALRDGELTLRYPHADGDFYRAFLGGEQDLQIRETTVSLRQKAATILMAGYRQPLDGQTEWATALEYNAATRAAAWSVKWQTRF